MAKRPKFEAHFAAYLVAIAGIATYSLMDAMMKSLTLAIGALAALLCRNVLGALIAFPIWYGGKAAMPSKAAMKLHIQRSFVAALMSFLFFWALARLPMAEAIAISFIAPVIALFMARALLGETVGKAAIFSCLFGMAGMGIIIAPRFGLEGEVNAADKAALPAVVAVLVSAALFAYNLILARRQALMAGPIEIAFMQSLLCALFLAPFALFFIGPANLLPTHSHEWLMLSGTAITMLIAAAMFGWAYARAEAQALIPVEYSGFAWAALFGWLFFQERLTLPLVFGTALIIAGSVIAARSKPKLMRTLEQPNL